MQILIMLISAIYIQLHWSKHLHIIEYIDSFLIVIPFTMCKLMYVLLILRNFNRVLSAHVSKGIS